MAEPTEKDRERANEWLMAHGHKCAIEQRHLLLTELVHLVAEARSEAESRVVQFWSDVHGGLHGIVGLSVDTERFDPEALPERLRELVAAEREASRLSAENEKLRAERDECAGALHRLATEFGIPDEGPDENVSSALALMADANERIAVRSRCLAFFASVIKGGEPWTDHCEKAFRAAGMLPEEAS